MPIAIATLEVLLLRAADLLEDMALGWGRQAAMRNARPNLRMALLTRDCSKCLQLSSEVS